MKKDSHQTHTENSDSFRKIVILTSTDKEGKTYKL